MSKLTDAVLKVRTFFQEVIDEMRKSTWPQRQELMESTVVVLVSLLLLSLFVGVSDKLLVLFFRLLTPSGLV
jgi:preprotein translocase subunit SecE